MRSGGQPARRHCGWSQERLQQGSTQFVFLVRITSIWSSVLCCGETTEQRQTGEALPDELLAEEHRLESEAAKCVWSIKL